MNQPESLGAAPMWRMVAVLAGVGAVAALPARAQYVQTYFPAAVPGYDQQLGVPVLQRARPEYAPQGIRLGEFTVYPDLAESFGYDTNPAALPSGKGSWELVTDPSLSFNYNGSNARFGGSVGAQNYQYFDLPNQDHTDWTASLGGSVTLRQNDQLSLGYSHLSLHENGYDVGSIASATPTPFQVDDARLAYAANLGQFTLTPNVDLQHWQYGTAQIGTVPVSQSYLDRNVLTAALTGRYALTDVTGALVVVAFSGSNFTQQVSGQPSNNSRSVLVLAGLDNTAGGLIRYRLLVGYEVRTFVASVYATHSAPVAEANVIWQPSLLTTVTADVSQTIEDATSEGTAGYNYTNAGLEVGHEYQRNILLEGRAGLQHAVYIEGGNGAETSYSLGAGITWLVSRQISVSFNYNYTYQTGTNQGNYSTPVTSVVGSTLGGPLTVGDVSFNSFTDNLFLLSVHFAL